MNRASPCAGGARLKGPGKSPQAGAPLISIITATRNALHHLPALASSIRAQTYAPIEWIVVDGASTDGTPDYLAQNEDVVDCWISEPDRGIYAAWNKGLRQARGEWICFLGADDFLWHPDSLQAMAATLSAVPSGCRVVYGRLAIVNASGTLLYTLGDPWPAVCRRFRSVMALPHPGLMHNRSLFETYGGFDTGYRIAGDYEFLLRELRHGDARFVEDVIVAGMKLGGLSTSLDASATMLREMRRASRTHGQSLPGTPWVAALIRHVLRRAIWQLLGERIARRMLDGGRWLLGKPPHWTRME